MSDREMIRLKDDLSRVTVIENNGTIDDLVTKCNQFVENMMLEEKITEKVCNGNITFTANNISSGSITRLRTDFKDHEIAKLVSDLADIAITYSGTQQLRQNISQYIVEAFKSTKQIKEY
jgi:hypothetical protein